MGVAAITFPSETIFSFELKMNFAFGIPISVSSGGLAMDADRLLNLVKALDGDQAKPKQFFLSSGMNGSALEHSVPEQLFSTPDNPAQGVSAVKALQIANEQGIPIYTINQSNINTIMPQLQIDADVKADIQNAVNAGKEVTVSKTNINFNGWNGCGYIIIDPVTGAGAYMISGGMNGGLLCLAVASVFVVLAVVTSQTIIGAFTFGMLAFALAFQGISLMYGDEAAQEFLDCLLEIVAWHYVVHIGKDAIQQYLVNPTLALLAKIEITYLLCDHAIKHFKKCLEDLYSHLFAALFYQKSLERI